MTEIKAPNSYQDAPRPYMFLAGSIEMGTAENWQERIVRELSDQPCTILNPRRDDWDSSWVQNKDNKQFREQVEWELEAQEESDLILMNFDPATKSPITLLELGLFCDGNMVVHCPEGFYRKGNVDIVCEYFKVWMVDTLEELIRIGRDFVTNWEKR